MSIGFGLISNNLESVKKHEAKYPHQKWSSIHGQEV